MTSSMRRPGKKVWVTRPAASISEAVRWRPISTMSGTAPPSPELNCGSVTLAPPSGIWPSLQIEWVTGDHQSLCCQILINT